MMWQYIESKPATTRSTNRIIASYGTANKSDLYDVLSSSKYSHAVKYGENFLYQEYETLPIHPAWYKIEFILQLFNTYDLVFFIDADAGICNIDYNIFDLVGKEDVTIAKTAEGINTGVFAIRKSENTMLALHNALACYNTDQTRLYEESALVNALNEAHCTMCFVDDTIFNASICTQTNDTAILHLMLDFAKTLAPAHIHYLLNKHH